MWNPICVACQTDSFEARGLKSVSKTATTKKIACNCGRGILNFVCFALFGPITRVILPAEEVVFVIRRVCFCVSRCNRNSPEAELDRNTNDIFSVRRTWSDSGPRWMAFLVFQFGLCYLSSFVMRTRLRDPGRGRLLVAFVVWLCRWWSTFRPVSEPIIKTLFSLIACNHLVSPGSVWNCVFLF